MMVDRTDGSADRKAYDLALEFLLGIEGVDAVLDKYLAPPEDAYAKSLGGVFEHLVRSLKNTGRADRVISSYLREKGVKELGSVLLDFDPSAVYIRYGRSSWGVLLQEVERELELRGKISRKENGLWPRFCKGILSGAAFLAQFEGQPEFDSWVRSFGEPGLRATLPMLIAEEVEGFGFPLACDFLKELGYTDYAKPDVHLKAIFGQLGLCRCDGNLHVFNAIVRMGNNVGQTAFHVDRLFWLAASGNFFEHKEEIPRKLRREEFIRFANARLAAD